MSGLTFKTNIGAGSNVHEIENSVLHTDIGFPLLLNHHSGRNCTIE